MGIVDRIKQKIKGQNTTIAAVERELGLGNGTISKWDKQSPSCNNMLKLANYLNCTIDYLLTGKEKSSPAEQLTADEQRLLTYYRQLSDIDKGIVIGKAETLAEIRHNDNVNLTAAKNDALTTSTVYSNMPSRVATGDFSDLIDAPDSTDEY